MRKRVNPNTTTTVKEGVELAAKAADVGGLAVGSGLVLSIIVGVAVGATVVLSMIVGEAVGARVVLSMIVGEAVGTTDVAFVGEMVGSTSWIGTASSPLQVPSQLKAKQGPAMGVEQV